MSRLKCNMGQCTRFLYLLHHRADKAYASLRICAGSPGPSLRAYTIDMYKDKIVTSALMKLDIPPFNFKILMKNAKNGPAGLERL